MKSGLAAGMIAARAAHCNESVNGKLVLAFAVGEETVDPETKTLLMDTGVEADFSVILGPTELIVDTADKELAWYTAAIRGILSRESASPRCKRAGRVHVGARRPPSVP